ncbi:hypothetical protein SAMN02799631_03500 [Methylobacterium sp. 174MFSha1.1]|uniref:DUF2336 domain-containing protein n=1 Tax=Methylobacterium sp. 174MFSha1.1 TaxID=1502749 RepID=UPI0008E9B6C0|nr:DUF2336 domain-containing protein [Methylobacterium sp. 174MFSha1.1]SFU96922.1 hypothetical protein SAMN02799631_03500 [Methylobacterium sp. 174MFSha1.1]
MASAAAFRPDRVPPAASLADLVEAAERVVDAGRTLDGVADLLVARAGGLSATQVGAFDEVLTVLVEGAGTGSRGRLARQVTALARPPRKLARRLACDPEASVAVPVLARCAALSDEVLLRVARSRGPVHLAAIARRETVAARVADVLADRGDEAVMGTLVANRGAQLSLSALTLLSARMEDRDRLAAGLTARGSLLPGQREALLRPAARPGPPRRAVAAVALRVRLGLDEADLRSWLAHGRTAEALIGLAHLAGCPPERAEAAHRAPASRALALIVRAADLRLSTLGAYLRARPGPAPTAEAAGAAVQAYRSVTVAQARALVAPQG